MSSIVPFQRDTSDDPPGDRMRLEDAEQRFADAVDATQQLASLADIAELARLVGEYERAIDASRRAIALAGPSGNERREAAHLVRLATSLQYVGRYEEALAVFGDFFARASHGFDHYRHFAHQHRGKCLVEMRRYEEAEAEFERALALREELDSSLAASTRRALEGLESHRGSARSDS